MTICDSLARAAAARPAGNPLAALLFLLVSLGLGFTAAACVTVDAETNEILPRGDQRYKFDTVKEFAENLETGMTKFQVLATVGSPAEKANGGDEWIYLPERPAVLIPSKALHLKFVDNLLTEHGYRAIILGQKL